MIEKLINEKIAINHYKSGHDEVIILAPGWFMTKDSKAFKIIAKTFSPYYDIITMDFRGHGKSKGFYTFSAKEPRDLKSVIRYAKQMYDKIYLMGFSLGAAVALICGASDKNIDKIIAISPPSIFSKIENHMWKKDAWLPTLKKIELGRWFSVRPSLIPQKKRSPIDIVDKIKAPTLFLAGENDPTVYQWHTKELFEKATCEKHLEIFKGGKHAEDLFLEDKSHFIEICLDWLSNHNHLTI